MRVSSGGGTRDEEELALGWAGWRLEGLGRPVTLETLDRLRFETSEFVGKCAGKSLVGKPVTSELRFF
jgi:hypothetical protein